MAKSNTLDQRTVQHVVAIERHDGSLMLPATLAIPDAIKLLQEHQAFQNQDVAMQRDYDAFPYDGAAALQRVLKHKYGWVPASPTPGFFRDNPPETIAVETGVGCTEQVAWGRFTLPGIAGYIETGFTQRRGRWVFMLIAVVKRAHEREIETLFEAVREELRVHSIYRGKAVRIRFNDDDGDALSQPDITFVATDMRREQLVFSRDLEAAIETNLFTPIERTADCKRNGIPVKRGVLLGGPYGTGKTLAAAVAANIAVEHGVTYVYVPRADELSQAIQFARQYDSPACVVFCEDVDRVMSGERSVEMDELLNIIDGIDGKRANIIVVLTTNFLDNINPALLRPGRLDAVLEVGPPDAEAAQRLLRLYGGAAIAASEDLSAVGEELAGQIPAVLAEVVKRAKLAELRRTPPGGRVEALSAEALQEAARTMVRQLALLSPPPVPQVPTLDQAFTTLVERSVSNGKVGKQLEAIHHAVA